MKTYIINGSHKGPRTFASPRFEFDAARYSENGSFTEFYDDEGELVKSINTSLIREIEEK